jgi:hypothetical protein
MTDTLSQIESWLLKAKDLGYGTVEFTVTIHDYQARVVEMKAKNTENKDMGSMTKRIVVKDSQE